MPEEINRILTDQLSDFLFTPSPDPDENLIREGIEPARIHRVGDVMIDTLTQFLAETAPSPAPKSPYALVTLYRPSNVEDLLYLRDV